ncbi:hypothetical protein CLOP_g3012 [Closterium sp. NIES-67]|nr:hypothetical protein CLOP_g3012 [Closterium sp. NIES-67]
MADSLSAETATPAASAPVRDRPFGRTKSVRELLGGGKAADVLLWKDWKSSAGILVSVAGLWIVFERSGFTLLTILADVLMILISLVFAWAQVSSLLNKPGPAFPALRLSEDVVRSTALRLRDQANRALLLAHDVALGKDYMLLIKVLSTLYLISVVGGWFHFLTLVFTGVLVAFTLPLLYDRYEDQVDAHLSQALAQISHAKSLLEDKMGGLLKKQKQKKVE